MQGTFSPLRWRDERWRVMESGCAMTDWQQSGQKKGTRKETRGTPIRQEEQDPAGVSWFDEGIGCYHGKEGAEGLLYEYGEAVSIAWRLDKDAGVY